MCRRSDDYVSEVLAHFGAESVTGAMLPGKVFELGNDVERCVAKEEINHPITITNDTDKELVTDVGHQFYKLFLTGMCINGAVAA